MKTQVLIAVVCCFPAFGVTAVTPTRCLAQVKSDLEFQISSNKPTYISGEPIIITSTLTNRGLAVANVREPTGLGLVSAFTLEFGEGDKKQVFPHLAGFGIPIFRAAKVNVPVGQSVANSCELGWQIIRTLEVGKYSLHAKYYRTNFEGPDYIEAKPIAFEIVEPSPQLKPVWEALSTALQTTDNQSKRVELESLLKQDRISVYRPVVLDELFYLEYGVKNYAAAVNRGRQLLSEPISDSKRELTRFYVAKAMGEAGDTEGAIDSLKNATLPNSYLLRKELEQKLAQEKK